MEALAAWFEGTWLNSAVGSYWWAWPVAETFHFIGLSLLVGVIGILDLRMLGMARGLSIASMHRLVPWGVAGFVINVLTGTAFIAGDPGRFLLSGAFQIKLVLIAIAGVNVVVFYLAIFRKTYDWPPDYDAPVEAKVIATISLALWLGVTLIGRFMAFI